MTNSRTDDDNAEDWDDVRIDSIFDDEDRERILEAASSRHESPESLIRDGVLEFVADALGDVEGHLECWVEGCEETFTRERKRRGHVGRVHSDNLPEGDFWCGICGFGPTTYSGIGAHVGQRHTGEDVRPLDHEPDPDELLDPDDVPDHMDRELLERLYYQCEGSYTEMCRRHDFGVTPGRVRHYLIEFGIHEVTPQGTGDDDHPIYRDRDWLEERYEAAGGNLSEMHRNLDIDVPYRTLVKNVNRFDFHDPTDPPGKRHGKGGSKPSTSEPPSSEDNGRRTDKEADPPPTESVDIPAEDRVYVLQQQPWPPTSGVYHIDEECWTMHRFNSDRDVVTLPWPRDELEEDDLWSTCGHCSDTPGGASWTVDPGDKLDHTDPEDLQDAYDRHDGVISRAAEEFAVTAQTLSKYLDRHGIRDPDAPTPPTDEDPSTDRETGTDGEDERERAERWCGRCGYGPSSSAGVNRHNGIVHEGEPILWDVEPDDGDLVGDDRDVDAVEDDIPEPPAEDPFEKQDDDGEDEGDKGPPIEWDFDPGFETVIEREKQDHDRLVEDANCVRCGQPYEGDGVCPSCDDGVVDELVTDGGRATIDLYRFECRRCESDTFYAVVSDGEWSFLRCSECEDVYDLDHFRSVRDGESTERDPDCRTDELDSDGGDP